MKPMDIWKKMFKIKFGLYEWLFMPFGLTIALKTFMRLFKDIFRPHLGKFVVIYLDDILDFSRSEDAHLQHVHTVLELPRKHQL